QSEPFGEALAGRGGQFRTCHLPLPFRTGKRFHSLQAGILRGTERGALRVFPHAREAAFSGRDGGRRSIAVGELGSSGSGCVSACGVGQGWGACPTPQSFSRVALTDQVAPGGHLGDCFVSSFLRRPFRVPVTRRHTITRARSAGLGSLAQPPA